MALLYQPTAGSNLPKPPSLTDCGHVGSLSLHYRCRHHLHSSSFSGGASVDLNGAFEAPAVPTAFRRANLLDEVRLRGARATLRNRSLFDARGEVIHGSDAPTDGLRSSSRAVNTCKRAPTAPPQPPPQQSSSSRRPPSLERQCAFRADNTSTCRPTRALSLSSSTNTAASTTTSNKLRRRRGRARNGDATNDTAKPTATPSSASSGPLRVELNLNLLPDGQTGQVMVRCLPVVSTTSTDPQQAAPPPAPLEMPQPVPARLFRQSPVAVVYASAPSAATKNDKDLALHDCNDGNDHGHDHDYSDWVLDVIEILKEEEEEDTEANDGLTGRSMCLEGSGCLHETWFVV